MRTSLRETNEIEQHILGTLTENEALLFKARLLIANELRDKVKWQKRAYNFIKLSGRKQLRGELENVHCQLFENPVHQQFSSTIHRLFRKK